MTLFQVLKGDYTKLHLNLVFVFFSGYGPLWLRPSTHTTKQFHCFLCLLSPTPLNKCAINTLQCRTGVRWPGHLKLTNGQCSNYVKIFKQLKKQDQLCLNRCQVCGLPHSDNILTSAVYSLLQFGFSFTFLFSFSSFISMLESSVY